MHHDGRPDERIGVQDWIWTLGSQNCKGGEVCEELSRRMIDVFYTGGEMEGTGCKDAGHERNEI